jgi:SAM-dependent methyltransferase
MDTGRTNGNEQSALWNGTAGRAWVETQDLLDHMFKPVQDKLVDAVSANNPRWLLDVGCGTGDTTLAASQRLGTQGHAVGIDISEQMIALARLRATREGLPTTFICDDAGRHGFRPAYFDMIISRFGVMFFDDAVEAFKVLRQATRKNGALHFYAWRSAAENPFMTTAERAANALQMAMPARRPDEPGQFAFGRKSRVAGILQESGWSAIDIEPVDFTCTFPEEDLVRYISWMGPLGGVLQKLDADERLVVVERVRAAFDPFVDGDEVRFIAACWKVSARAA